jgi:GAF domain-containing protein
LLESLVDQLGVALENARLYEDTQRRAAREKLVSELTAQMRESLNVEVVLRTATQEIYNTLELSEVEVRMRPQSDRSLVASDHSDESIANQRRESDEG